MMSGSKTLNFGVIMKLKKYDIIAIICVAVIVIISYIMVNLLRNDEADTVVIYVDGKIENKSGTLEDYLYKDERNNISKVVNKGKKNAKFAKLDYDVIKYDEVKNLSLVKVNLHTGRHHQIRVQMAGKKAGIWGDTKYNPKFQKVKKKYQQIALYASRLEFIHPVTGEHMVFKNEPEGKAFEIIDLDEF